MDYDKIEYEYNIVSALNRNYNDVIKTELKKVINSIADMIKVSYPDSEPDAYYNGLCRLFFGDNITEYGQIGNRRIRTKTELDTLINTLNIRELFTILNNFRKNVDCFMFKILLEYKKDPKKFVVDYPFLNEKYIKYIIKFIENMLNVNLIDLSLCYNEEFIEVPCEQPKVPFYRQVHEDNISYPNVNYHTICTLWLPYTYFSKQQLLLKEMKPNKLTDIAIKGMRKKINEPECAKKMLEKFPFVERLSSNEQQLLNLKNSNQNNFMLMICNMEANDMNFTTQLRKKYNKLLVSYTSGHTIIMLLLCKYFKDVNLGLIVLGCIIWLVPYNHSITEIFLAAKELNVFKDYTLNKSTFESVNQLLKLCGLPELAQEPNVTGGFKYKNNYKNKHKTKRHYKLKKGRSRRLNH